MKLKGTFFIASLPRSRTAWLANFLTYGPSCCYHEILRMCTSIQEMKAIFENSGVSYVGDSDSGIPFFVDEMAGKFPKARFVVIDRPIKEVVVSLEKTFPQSGDDFSELVEKTATALEEMKKRYHPMVVPYSELGGVEACRKIWNYCLPTVPFNEIRWKTLHPLKIEIIPEIYLKSFTPGAAQWLQSRYFQSRIKRK